MCGIAGIITTKQPSFSEEQIKRSTRSIHHRGPEGQGFWNNGNGGVIFGHRRLCIIDLTEDAAQPMHYNNRYTIIYNGEIYNYLEVKMELVKKGLEFHSASDTEVVLAAYATYGNDCLNKFDGMFAFAIWDEQEQTLFAARDRFGEKPFFFHFDGSSLHFASEIKALFEMGATKEVNRSMLYNFLTIGYTQNPSDASETFYNGINKLPPAHSLTYTLADNKLIIERYWQVDLDINNNIKEDEAIDRFTSLFSESIKMRLRSDVSIGTSLSGGLDSSAVVAFCERHASAQYSHKCFTASFAGYEKDESAFASLVAKQYGLQHFFTTINTEDVASLMQAVMKQQDEPFSSASVLAQYKVFQLAKENSVTVLLDGQGADETLAGYHKYYRWYWQELYRIKKLNKSGELHAAKSMGVTEKFTLREKVAALMPEFTTALLQTSKAKRSFKDANLHPDFRFSNKRNSYYATPTTHDLNGVLYYNSFVNGLEELLRLADRNSMAHSVEVRLPFLNHKLVEYLFSLPPHLKINKGWTKWILRKAVDQKLAKEIVWRKDKIGYEPPQEQWMKDKKVQEAIMEGKEKLARLDILDPAAARKKVQPHTGYAAENFDWKYWSASYLFD